MGRSMAQARFTETLDFFRLGDGEDENGVPIPNVEIPVHAGIPGRVKFPSTVVSGRESAGQLVAVQQPRVDVAVGATPDVREGDFCRVTASTVDPGLVGRKVRIAGLPTAGQVTAWRFPATEAS